MWHIAESISALIKHYDWGEPEQDIVNGLAFAKAQKFEAES